MEKLDNRAEAEFKIALAKYYHYLLVELSFYFWCLHLGGALSRRFARVNCEDNSSVLHASCPLQVSIKLISQMVYI